MKSRLPALLLALAATSAQALYDPAPKPWLTEVEGRWSGSLTYRDYGGDHREITLPAIANIALVAPDELAFHAVYDDGPKKTVHSYERLKFDFEAKSLAWTHGLGADESRRYRIDSNSLQDGVAEMVATEVPASQGEAPQCVRYTLRWSRTALDLVKREGRTCETTIVRSRSSFRRAAS